MLAPTVRGRDDNKHTAGEKFHLSLQVLAPAVTGKDDNNHTAGVPPVLASACQAVRGRNNKHSSQTQFPDYAGVGGGGGGGGGCLFSNS